MSSKRVITVMASFAWVLAVASAAPLLTPSASSAVQGQGWFWCAWDSGESEHLDFSASTDPEELPGGPLYKSIPPQNKHADDITIGSVCWDGGVAESHTKYND